MLNRRERLAIPCLALILPVLGGCSLWQAPAESRVTLVSELAPVDPAHTELRVAFGSGLGSGDQLGNLVHFNDIVLASRLGVDLYDGEAMAAVEIPAGE